MLAPGLTKSFRFGVVLFALFFATSADAGHTIQQGGPGHTIRPTSVGARPVFSFTAPAAGAYASLTAATGQAITCTRASTGTYQTSATALATAAAASGTCRVDYRGLLVEESRTNLVLSSQDVSTWAPSGSPAAPSVLANQLAAPDGTTTAAKITYGAVASTQYSLMRKSVTLTATTYAQSAWIQGAAPGTTFLNLSSATEASCSVTTGWTRCSTVKTTGGTLFFDIGFNDSNFSDQSTSGLVLYPWGAQIEAGAFATSLIPTTTTAVTRSADVIDVGAVTLPASYSLSATVNPEGLAGTETSLYATDGTHTRSLAVDASGHAVCTYGATSDSTTSTLSVGAATKIACKYDGTKIYACLAGACTTGTAAASDGATAMTHLYVGSNGSANFANGFISTACMGKSGACAP